MNVFGTYSENIYIIRLFVMRRMLKRAIRILESVTEGSVPCVIPHLTLLWRGSRRAAARGAIAALSINLRQGGRADLTES